MKLTNKYFKDSLRIIKLELNRGNPVVIWILEQLARDAAEAQRELCFEWCRLKLVEDGCSTCDLKLPIPTSE